MKNNNWFSYWGVFIFVFFLSCEKELNEVIQKESLPPIPALPTRPFAIVGNEIQENDTPLQFKGVNALQTFGLGDASLMNDWKVGIVREFIGNLREQPIIGSPIQASDGVWYHPLQSIVDQNRANQKITILCPFGWVNASGQRQLFTGLNPSEQYFYEDYKLKMQEIARHFKDQTDVWIEVWNEPYHWDNKNNYSHEKWLKDQEEMVDNLRIVEGFQNIILVPGNEQGQSEAAIHQKGPVLLEGRYNILFDLHAYEKWLNNTTEEELIQRIEGLHNRGFAFLIGEVGVENVGGLMPVDHFLAAADVTQSSVLAWLWNKNSADKNALLNDEGLPNDTLNNAWGSAFKNFLNR